MTTTKPACGHDLAYRDTDALVSSWTQRDSVRVLGTAGQPPTFAQICIAFDLEMRRHGDSNVQFRQPWAQA
jgi:hypothetical protein